jgi:hypothetical protein
MAGAQSAGQPTVSTDTPAGAPPGIHHVQDHMLVSPPSALGSDERQYIGRPDLWRWPADH